MRLALSLALLAFAAVPALAQPTVLLSEDFETDGNGTRYTTSTPEFSDGARDYFTRTDGSTIGPSVEFTNPDGFFFAAQDIDGEGANRRQTLTFSGIDITGFSTLTLSMDVAEDDLTGESWDPADLVHASFVLDGNAPMDFETGYAIWFDSNPTLGTSGVDGRRNAPPFLNFDFDADGGDSPQDTEVTDTFVTFSRMLGFDSDDATIVDLVITFDLNDGGEDIAIDNIVLIGDAGTTVNQELTNTAGWRLLSVPVQNYTVGDLADLNLVQGVAGQYPTAPSNVFTDYTSATADPNEQAYVSATGEAQALVPGEGFFWYLYDNNVVPDPNSFGGGDSRSYDVAVRPLTATGMAVTTDESVTFAQSVNGFYMIGNPFSDPLAATGIGFTGNGTFQTNVSAYNPATESYVNIDRTAGDNFLATWQGVFAEVQGGDAGGATFSYDVSETDDSEDPTFYGRTAVTSMTLVLTGTVSNADGDAVSVADRAATVRVREDAVLGWDRHDASKLLPPTDDFALLAFDGVRDGEAVLQSVLSLGETLSGSVEIPLSFVSTGDGSFAITPEGLDALPGWTASIVDGVTDVSYALTEGTPLSFEATAGDWTDRFTVVFTAASTAGEEALSGVEIGSVVPNPSTGSARITVRVASSEAITATVFDALGRQVAVAFEGVVADSATVTLPGDLAPGVYVVRVQGATFGESRQFVVTR